MELLKYYKWGDRLGSRYEGGVGGKHKAIQGESTDESDIIRCWELFLEDSSPLEFKSPEEFAMAWYRFHERNYRPVKYGKTWQDHFALMRVKDVTYEKVVQISRDRGSKGNGALVMVYPVYVVSRMFGINAVMTMTHKMISGTHNRPSNIYFDLANYFLGGCGLKLLGIKESTSLAGGCLFYASLAAQEENVRKVIRKAYEIGGDVDSVLSLAILLHMFEKRRKNER